MFRSDAQKSEAIKVLLALAGIDHMWKEPPNLENQVNLANLETLSTSERSLLLAACSVWRPTFEGPGLGRLIQILHPTIQYALWSLLRLAANNDDGENVNEWMETWKGVLVR
jgi:hypothetical protein